MWAAEAAAGGAPPLSTCASPPAPRGCNPPAPTLQLPLPTAAPELLGIVHIAQLVHTRLAQVAERGRVAQPADEWGAGGGCGAAAEAGSVTRTLRAAPAVLREAAASGARTRHRLRLTPAPSAAPRWRQRTTGGGRGRGGWVGLSDARVAPAKVQAPSMRRRTWCCRRLLCKHAQPLHHATPHARQLPQQSTATVVKPQVKPVSPPPGRRCGRRRLPQTMRWSVCESQRFKPPAPSQPPTW